MRRRYVQWGLAIFVTVATIMLFYDTLFGSRVLLRVGKKLIHALAPVIWGAMMAYLLAPSVDFLERWLFQKQVEKARARGQMCSGGVRAVSVTLTWAWVAVLLYLLASVLLPDLYRSVEMLVSNAEDYYITIRTWVEQLLANHPSVEVWAAARMDEYFRHLVDWLQTEALPQAQVLMSAVTGGISMVLSFVKNLLVGVIVSIYLMATKERSAAQCRKLVYSIADSRQVFWIFRCVHRIDEIFSGFVRGKLLDSLIIGILCFIGCTALRMPYTALVSVIVGVTNVIPFFGPFLGAIPSIFLILLVSPVKALYFAIFVLALQQLDGNVIGPKILGEHTGLSSLGVIIAILVGGSFFGVPGMFFGVPVCACLYSLVTFLVETELKKRNLPVESEAYTTDQPRQQPPEEKEIQSGEPS